ncbi:Protein of unknown function [Gryllus bimaculatus]|nr:Protein of unknown function [Gryllus bimaculatus]
MLLPMDPPRCLLPTKGKCTVRRRKRSGDPRACRAALLSPRAEGICRSTSAPAHALPARLPPLRKHGSLYYSACSL